MKTSASLRILFTLAILAGLAAAPSAQTFRWRAGQTDAVERAERALQNGERARERALQNAQRRIERAERNAERIAERAARQANLTARRIQRGVQRRIDAQVRAQIRREMRMSLPRVRIVRPVRGYRYGSYIGDSEMQNFDQDPCRNRDRDDQFCEVRTESMAAGPLTVNAGPNGGIAIEGWDRNEIRVQAVVQARADDAARARQLAQDVRILVGNGRVTSEGPRNGRDESWSVSFRINVPRKNDLDLDTNNGGISIKNVSGNMKFETNNGGVTLTDLAGSVRGATRNGGLSVSLSGSRWDGEGIDVQTTNGGVTLSLPEGYNAQLEARTVNGGLSANYPLTITGELSTRRGITTTLGSGGPLVRIGTTNGGLRITKN
jgi:hypothetical protein